MGAYERTILHTIKNRTSGEGKSELGLAWYAEKLVRDIDRGCRHFWAQPHRQGMEPPPVDWRINRAFLFGSDAGLADKKQNARP